MDKMRLNEYKQKFNRLIGEQFDTMEELRLDINEMTPIATPFKLVDLLGQMALRPIKEKFPEVENILKKLDMPSVKAIEYDEIGGIIRNINMKTINSAQLEELFRIPQVREALEDYAKNYKPGGPNGPVYPINLETIRLTDPASDMTKIITAYRNAGKRVIKTGLKDVVSVKKTTFVKNISDKLYDFYVENIKLNNFIIILRDVDTKGVEKQMDDLKKNFDTLVKEYENVMKSGTGVVNHQGYQKKLYEIIRELKIYHKQIQKDVFDILTKKLNDSPNVKTKLSGDLKDISYEDLEKFWSKLKNVSENIKSIDNKYNGFFDALGKMFASLKPGVKSDWKRITNTLVFGDARLREEMVSNVRYYGKPKFYLREVAVRSLISAVTVGLIDLFLAQYKESRGQSLFNLSITEPTKEWQNPGDPESTYDNVKYFASFVGDSMLSRFLKDPLHVALMGPIPRAITNYFKSSEIFKNRTAVEQKNYQEGLDKAKDDVKNKEEYKNASPEKQVEILKDVEKDYKEYFKIFSGEETAKKSLKKLDN